MLATSVSHVEPSIELANLVSEKVRAWYSANQRNLSFRHTKDPYLIWLSEIILQQTQVKQGLPYYEKFKDTFPTVEALAGASQDEVLRLWQGLGYYSRGRNLHHTAQIITEAHKGIFPNSYTELLKLKGIGSYTAAAIASFAFGEAVAVLDGNVFRVLARLFGVDTDITSGAGKRIFSDLAAKILCPEQSAMHNYAMMEFGSQLCKPHHPDCVNCPLQEVCVANQKGRQRELPFKAKKIKLKDKFFHYLVVQKDGLYAFNKRDDSNIWAGLYEFPLIETLSHHAPLPSCELLAEPKKHLLTHQKLWIHFWQVAELPSASSSTGWFSAQQIETLPKPKPITEFCAKLCKI